MVRLAAILLGGLGAAVFLAILFARVGNALIGAVGIAAGDLLGTSLAGALVGVMALGLFQQGRYWRWTLLSLGMSGASLLWFIFADGLTGVAPLRVEQPGGYNDEHPAGYDCPFAWSPDGRFAIVRGRDGAIPLWNAEAGSVERYLEGSAGEISSFAFTADGRKVLAGGKNGIVRLWNVDTGHELRRFSRAPARQLAVSPDGQLALEGSKDDAILEIARRLSTFSDTSQEASFDGTMRLWDVARQQEIRRFERHTGWVTCVAFCPDGRRAIAGYYDWSIRLWDLESGEELHRFAGHRAAVSTVAVSPDGHSALSGSFDGAMRLWDLDGGVQAGVFLDDALDPVQDVSFSAAGRLAEFWTVGGNLRVWEPKK